MSELEKLVRVSRLYYELGETQGAIAEQLGVTRPQVSRLLKRARAEGVVEIRIVDRATAESPAARR
jgi:deoxyribonucleoside regulator